VSLIVVGRQIDLFRRPRLPSRQEWRDGLAFCATSGVGAAAMETDKVVAIRTVDTHEAGLYATLSRIVAAGVLPVIGMLLSAQPRLFEFAREAPGRVRALALQLAGASAALGLTAALGLNVCAPLLHIILGERFSGLSALVPWMSLVMPAMCLRLTGTQIMLTLGKPAWRIAIDTGGIAVLSIGLSIGGRIAGVPGLAMGLLASELLTAAAAWTLVALALRRHRTGQPAS
jgi:O-antigen/teichoic acid export membrane protein